MKKREELSLSPEHFRGTLSSVTMARSLGRPQQSEFNARRGAQLGQKVCKQLDEARGQMRHRIGNLKGYNDLENVLHKLYQTIEICLENEDTVKNPGFYNTVEQIQEDLIELDRFTLKFSKKAIKAFSKTAVRRKVQNIKTSLRGKNTALDILSGIGLSTQPMIVSQKQSPEVNKEQELEINEMKGDIRHFQLMIQDIQKNADKQTLELNQLKKKQDKPRLHEAPPKPQEVEVPQKMQNHEKLCMEADQAYYGHGCSQNIPLAIQLYKKAAAQGNAKSMVALAKLLEKGIGVKKDPEEAYQYYKEAAEMDNPEALFRLGQIYEKGNPFEQPEMVNGRAVPPLKTAIEYYERAAEQGFSEAMTHLGLMYEKGENLHTNLETAEELYNGAAKRNHPAGLNHLGSFIFKFKKDHKTAAQFFQRAADLGCPQGKNNLGICYEFGYGVVQDLNMAFQLYKESAELMFAPAMANLAFQYIKMAKQKNNDETFYTEAAEWLRSAIHRDKSLKDAYFCLASLYEHGLGADKDSKTAFKYYKLASESGVAKASTKCGDLLYSGVGVLRPHKTEAVEYYKKAIEQGDPQALNNLALVYQSGFDGNPPDYFEAAKWYERGIEKENADAILNYAILVQNHGVRPQLEKARIADLLKLSARLGNKEAKKLLISNNLISSLDQIASKDPMLTLEYILTSKHQREKSSPSSPFRKKQGFQMINGQPQAEVDTFLRMHSITRMMTGEQDDNEDDLDLPSAPNSRIKSFEPDFNEKRERRLSRIEKRRPMLAL